MKTQCPHCGQHYDLDESYVGQEVTCEKCNNDFVVSAPVIKFPKPVQIPPPRTQAEPAPQDFRCPFCGGELAVGAMKCRHCGEWLARSSMPKNPVIYVMLSLVLGMFGVHNFYSGARNRGFLKILVEFGLPCLVLASAVPCFIFCSDSSKIPASMTVVQIAYSIAGCASLFVLICNVWEMIDCHRECDKAKDVRLFRIIYILLAVSLGFFGLHNFYYGAKFKGMMKLAATMCFTPIMTTVIFIVNAVFKWRIDQLREVNSSNVYTNKYIYEEISDLLNAREIFLVCIAIIAGMYIFAILVWVVVDIVMDISKFREELDASDDEFPAEI